MEAVQQNFPTVKQTLPNVSVIQETFRLDGTKLKLRQMKSASKATHSFDRLTFDSASRDKQLTNITLIAIVKVVAILRKP